MKRIAIISPSGKFYGSEQVLFDFLTETKHCYEVYVLPGIFYDILLKQQRHIIHKFNSVKKLYLRLALLLLIGRFDGIYINEGGHIRYLNLLAKLFPNKKFFAHIRLIEDTTKSRLQGTPANVTLIAVSDYIAYAVKKQNGLPVVTVYDLYRSGYHIANMHKPLSDLSIINIGIVGRLTDTKGIEYIEKFCDYAEHHSRGQIIFHFFGNIDKQSIKVNTFVVKTNNYKIIKCKFHGFVDDKNAIYRHIDILLHFNQYESLGRIAFEALDYGIPFIGFNRGGVGEIASHLGLSEFMINPDDSDWSSLMLNNVFAVLETPTALHNYECAKQKMQNVYSPQKYVSQIELLFS